MLYPDLARYLVARNVEFEKIDPARMEALAALRRFVAERVARGLPASIVFICTHNSRRSHLAQVWARVAAVHYDVPHVATFSGGSEVTACHPHTLAALVRTGLAVEPTSTGDNPVYRVRYADSAPPIVLYSKHYSHAANPGEDFCAVMTCTEADRACPVVAGAAQRLSIAYEDPKAADGTAREAAVYDVRCRQICREMMYVFSSLPKKSNS